MNHWVFYPLDHIPTLLLPKATDPRRNSHHRSRQYCADMFSLSADLNYYRWHWHGPRVAAKIVCLDSDRTQVSNYRDVYSSDRSFQCFQNSHSVVQSISCFRADEWTLYPLCSTHQLCYCPSELLCPLSISVSHSFSVLPSSSFLFHFLFLCCSNHNLGQTKVN